jgi:hypothetical protein
MSIKNLVLLSPLLAGTLTALQGTSVNAAALTFESDAMEISASSVSYVFEVEDFSGGGSLSGSFEGTDINSDGRLIGDSSQGVSEITNFLAEFTGDSLVRDLTFRQEELFFQSGWTFLPSGELELGFFDIVVPDPTGPGGPALITSGQQIVVSGPTGSNEFSVAASGDTVARPVPEPYTVLGSLAAVSVGALMKRRMSK